MLVSKRAHEVLKSIASSSLIGEIIKRASFTGSVCKLSISFLNSMLQNSCKRANRWRWPASVLAFFGNVLSRIGRSNYSFLSGGINSPSLSSLKRLLSQRTLDLVHGGEGAIWKVRLYFDSHPDLERSFILQHDGISIKPVAVWTKDNNFLSFVPARKSLSHALDGIAESRTMELAQNAEVYMVSAVYSQFKLVIRIDSCGHSENGLDYYATLDDILEQLDCQGIEVQALCFDAATATVKSLKIAQGFQSDKLSLYIPDDGKIVRTVQGFPDAHAARSSSRTSSFLPKYYNSPVANEVPIEEDQSAIEADIACSEFRTGFKNESLHFIPRKLQTKVIKAHHHFPVYFEKFLH